MALPPPPPPVPTAVAPAQTAGPPAVLLGSDARTVAVAGDDLPLLLVKAKRGERAVVRRQLFLNTTATLVRPTGADVPSCRWTAKAYLQRQICFSSMTGLFACTEPEARAVGEESEGETPAAPDATISSCQAEGAPGEVAITAAGAAVRTRAPQLFAQDEREQVMPLFKAAGVTASPAPPSH